MATYDKQYTGSVSGDGENLGRAVLEKGQQAISQAREIAEERPYSLILAAGVTGLALGALWKLGHRRKATTYEALLARADALRQQAPSMKEIAKYIPQSWR